MKESVCFTKEQVEFLRAHPEVLEMTRNKSIEETIRMVELIRLNWEIESSHNHAACR